MDAAAHGGQVVSSRALVEQLCCSAPDGALNAIAHNWGYLGAAADAGEQAGWCRLKERGGRRGWVQLPMQVSKRAGA